MTKLLLALSLLLWPHQPDGLVARVAPELRADVARHGILPDDTVVWVDGSWVCRQWLRKKGRYRTFKLTEYKKESEQ